MVKLQLGNSFMLSNISHKKIPPEILREVREGVCLMGRLCRIELRFALQ